MTLKGVSRVQSLAKLCKSLLNCSSIEGEGTYIMKLSTSRANIFRSVCESPGEAESSCSNLQSTASTSMGLCALSTLTLYSPKMPIIRFNSNDHSTYFDDSL